MHYSCCCVLSGATLTAVASVAAARPLPEFVGAALGPRSEDISALLKAVRAAIGDPSALVEWLATLDSGQVAARSYWHRNGFAKLVLHVGDNFRIRMHVWPAGKDRLGEFHPHGHRWNFASTVLCGGGLRTEEFEESSDGKPYVRHRYVGGGVNGLAADGEVGLKAKWPVKIVAAGDQHSVDIEVIHTVHPVGDDLVATLVVQSRLLTNDTAVYCAQDEVLDDAPSAITPAEVSSLLEAVSNAVRSGQTVVCKA